MIAFAWLLVAGGLAFAVVAPIALTYEAGRWGAEAQERAPFVESSALDRVGFLRAKEAERELLGWRPVAISCGLAISTVGIIVLAIWDRR